MYSKLVNKLNKRINSDITSLKQFIYDVAMYYQFILVPLGIEVENTIIKDAAIQTLDKFTNKLEQYFKNSNIESYYNECLLNILTLIGVKLNISNNTHIVQSILQDIDNININYLNMWQQQYIKYIKRIIPPYNYKHHNNNCYYKIKYNNGAKEVLYYYDK